MSVQRFIRSTAVARARARVTGRRIMPGNESHRFTFAEPMLVMLALLGCGRSDNTPDPAQLASAPAQIRGSLALTLEAPAQVRSGESVPLRLVLENRGDEPAEVELGGDPIAFDFVITADDGAEVWSRLEGVAVSDILQSRTLAPGETIEFTDSWEQRGNDGRRVSPGTYSVRGVLPVVPDGWSTDARTMTIVQ
ncbi:MAG: BsuPI-related putative proteinase inhibitor [Longimicrobiales bacterium]